MSQSAAARTARLDPSLIAITISRPRRISTTVWVTAPPSNTRAAPWVRLVRPDVTAASWSTRSAGNPCENAIGSPSDETTIACATEGTRSTKLVISQFRSCAGRTSGLTRAPSFCDLPLVHPPTSPQGLAHPSSGSAEAVASARPPRWNRPPRHVPPSSSRSGASSSPRRAARPSLIPRWKFAKRSLVAAAERAGAGAATGSDPAVPGTRFAFGTRFGRPAGVMPLEDGVLATSAARQPSSAGEVQVAAFSSSCPGPATACRPRRNQSDSTDSKIGSLLSSLREALGGTTTPPCTDEPGDQPIDERLSPAGPSRSATLPAVGAPSTGCGLVPNPSALAAKGSALAAKGSALAAKGSAVADSAGAGSGATGSGAAGSGAATSGAGGGRAGAGAVPDTSAAGLNMSGPSPADSVPLPNRSVPFPARTAPAPNAPVPAPNASVPFSNRSGLARNASVSLPKRSVPLPNNGSRPASAAGLSSTAAGGPPANCGAPASAAGCGLVRNGTDGPAGVPGRCPAPGTRRVRRPPLSSASARSGANFGVLAAVTASSATERSPLPHSPVLKTPATAPAGAGPAVANPEAAKPAAAGASATASIALISDRRSPGEPPSASCVTASSG